MSSSSQNPPVPPATEQLESATFIVRKPSQMSSLRSVDAIVDGESREFSGIMAGDDAAWLCKVLNERWGMREIAKAVAQ